MDITSALEIREPDTTCNARKKDGSGHCTNVAGWGTDHVGTGRCKLHGGASLAGREHPGYKHGRRSMTLPRRMLSDFQDALTDETLLSLRGDIALVDSRLTDLLRRVDTGEAGSLWRQARVAMTKFKAARESSSMEPETKRRVMAESLDELESIILRGNSDYKAWDEVLRAVNERRRLIESEHKRAVAMGQMMTADAVLTLIDSINRVIQDTIQDGELRAKVATGIMSLIDKDADYEEGDFTEV